MSGTTTDPSDLLRVATLRWFDEASAQGIFTTDAELTIRSWNRTLERFTGLPAAKTVGRHLFDVIPELQSRQLDAHFRAALAGEGRLLAHHFHKYLIPGRPGAPEPAQSARIAPLEVDGIIVGTLTVVQDVSDRVASERELRSRIEAAEAARGMAENALRVKDEFLATLSHELRTPLNAVLGWTKILLGRSVDPAMLTRALQVIDRNAVAQTRLIDDMLDMARVMSGKLRLDMQPVDLASIALSAVDVITPTAHAKGVRLVTDIVTDQPWMIGDPDRLQQIIWNLLSNATKFTESGGTVSLAISRTDTLLTVRVSDTGVGVPADFLPHMFERFRQADASANRRQSGLGLGLALVQTLVELHGGVVSVSSTEGVGSVFTVTFPARTDLSDPPEAPVSEEDFAHAVVGLQVLIIEDDQDARDILATALRSHGVDVTATGSAAEGIGAVDAAASSGHLPDIIVSDIGLPGEDGYKLLESLAARPASLGGEIPVIAVTAYGRPQDKRRALAAGFRMHLTKPVDPATLLMALATVIGRRS
jgi:PAS domain S-box-containing protein